MLNKTNKLIWTKFLVTVAAAAARHQKHIHKLYFATSNRMYFLYQYSVCFPFLLKPARRKIQLSWHVMLCVDKRESWS